MEQVVAFLRSVPAKGAEGQQPEVSEKKSRNKGVHSIFFQHVHHAAAFSLTKKTFSL